MTISSSSKPSQSLTTVSIGGKFAVLVFVCALFGYVIESILSQYVQRTLKFHQPFFIFYIVHSALALIFPLHLLFLSVTTGRSKKALWRGLAIAICNHLRQDQNQSLAFPLAEFLRLTLSLTVGISLPSVLWFIAISLAPLTDVTAIANTSAFWSYMISVKLFKLRWQPKRLLAVLCATLGTLGVIYGGAKDGEQLPVEDEHVTPTSAFKPSARLIGNICILISAFGTGLYQNLYKMFATLPVDPTPEKSQLNLSDEEDSDLRKDAGDPSESTRLISSTHAPRSNEAMVTGDAVYPPPFGLHPNFITSVLGFFTCTILWIPLVVLHWTGVEPFRLPLDGWTWLVLGAVSACGVTFNAGFMVLLGVWGPIIVSVGNLLTIVLVLMFDVLLGPGLGALTMWTLLGSGSIILAFGVLSYDMFSSKAS